MSKRPHKKSVATQSPANVRAYEGAGATDAPLTPLGELRWLRGSILSVHVMFVALAHVDTADRGRVDLDALAYLVDEMQLACQQGALADIITRLEGDEEERIARLRKAPEVEQ